MCLRECVCLCVFVCGCLFVNERERGRESHCNKRERERERFYAASKEIFFPKYFQRFFSFSETVSQCLKCILSCASPNLLQFDGKKNTFIFWQIFWLLCSPFNLTVVQKLKICLTFKSTKVLNSQFRLYLRTQEIKQTIQSIFSFHFWISGNFS